MEVPQSWSMIVLFMGVIVSVPFLIKWLKIDKAVSKYSGGHQSKLISVLVIGPGQKIVTVEVGQPADRQSLVLGVTANSISLLYKSSVEASNLMMPPQGQSLQKFVASDNYSE